MPKQGKEDFEGEKVRLIAEFCSFKIDFSFGIATDFTIDVGLKSMNIVIKMDEGLPEPWTPVVNLSGVPGKHSGSKQTIELAKQVLSIKE